MLSAPRKRQNFQKVILVAVANRLAREAGISEKGYRLVVNCGPDGGQIVPHLHLHLLGGRQMGMLG